MTAKKLRDTQDLKCMREYDAKSTNKVVEIVPWQNGS